MPRAVSLRGVRRALLAGVVLLLAVLAAFIGYARWRVHGLMRDLPGRLGVHITQESDNVTYSQSYKGRTIYTFHAAKQIQKKDGRYTLHDVGMILYGAKGDRADRIHGSEFEYDQQNGVLSAVGDVYLDLGAPSGPGKPALPPAEQKMIHVKTSGLTFLEKQRTATTDAQVEFSSGEMSGRAIGATYDAGSGTVVLRSAVRMSGLHASHAADSANAAANARPIALTAARAEMDRIPASSAETRGAAAIGLAAAGNGNLVHLDDARVLSPTAHGQQSISAQHALIRLAEDGNPRHIDGDGHVTLTQQGRAGSLATLTSQRIAVDLNPAGQATAAQMSGDVQLHNTAQSSTAQGSAHDAKLDFDPQGRPTRALLTGAVIFNQQTAQPAKDQKTSAARQLQAEKVDLALAGGGKEKVILRQVIASGPQGARLHLSAPGKQPNSLAETAVRADTLTARFAAPATPKAKTTLTAFDGQGSTRLEQLERNAAGVLQSRETSTGDALTVAFHDVDGRQEIARAQQRGSQRDQVAIETESLPQRDTTPGPHPASAKASTPQLTHARADLALYDHTADTLTLTGSVQVADSASSLFADRVQTQRTTGDSIADGAVRVTYIQPASAGPGAAAPDPVHVLAARALSHRATGITEFFASPGAPPSAQVKMWQGGSQIQAPIITLDRTRKTMLAHDDPSRPVAASDAVHAVLVNQPPVPPAPDAKLTANAKPSQSSNPTGPIRITTREMRYTDATETVELHGGVRLLQSDATMRAQDATIFLATPPTRNQPTPKVQPGTSSAPAPSLPTGSIDHILATGEVKLDQPGRKATGERLLYTAADQTFILTGTHAQPPVLVDDQRGTVTGAMLTFRKGDEAVTVSGSDNSGATRRVTTQTRVKQ